MRVLHFYKAYFPESLGGIEQTIFQMARATANKGAEIEVLSLTKGKIARTIRVDNHQVHRAQQNFQIKSTAFSFSVFSLFSRLAKKADIIHYHYPWPFMDIVHFVTRAKKPTVVTYHSDIIRQKRLLKIYRPLKNLFLKSADRIVATSPNYFETSKVLNRYREKTRVIPLGLDKSSYPPPSADILNKWQSEFGSRFFLFVGTFRYYKGLHILLEAIRDTALPVVIVGSGPIEKELKTHAEKVGLQNVHFLGALPEEDKTALLQLCYAVVFPSHLRAEAFGLSLLEAAMFGKPMISSEIGTGTSYINIHNKTGLVVPPGDPEKFRAAMQSLWNDPELAGEMGRRAEERYWKLFTAERMALSYMDLYHELLRR